jgi:hypothetical protein
MNKLLATEMGFLRRLDCISGMDKVGTIKTGEMRFKDVRYSEY